MTIPLGCSETVHPGRRASTGYTRHRVPATPCFIGSNICSTIACGGRLRQQPFALSPLVVLPRDRPLAVLKEQQQCRFPRLPVLRRATPHPITPHPFEHSAEQHLQPAAPPPRHRVPPALIHRPWP